MDGFYLQWCGLVTYAGQPLLSDTICQRRLSFGHLGCADTGQDHSRALRACIRGPPKDWRQKTGRPRQTWLRTVEDDLRPLNFGLATARRRAMDRPARRLLVDAATSSWHAPERERERTKCKGVTALLVLDRKINKKTRCQPRRSWPDTMDTEEKQSTI